MKIILPVGDNNGLNSAVFGHFGSAPFFAVFDTDSQSVNIIANSTSEHEHGSCMPIEALMGLGADAVLCKGMGMRAADNLIASGIKSYIVDADTVSDAVTEFKNSRVTELNAGNACQHHGCHH